MEQRLFIFGLGYTALVLAGQAAQREIQVSGTCRAPERCNLLRAAGVDAFLFDDVPSSALEDASHLLISIPPRENGDPALARYREGIVKAKSVEWIGYLSTTGVYGDHQGGWVDESTPVNPPNERLERRVKAEEAWLALWREQGLPVHIFRLAGIYGPGRNAIEDVLDGTARRIDKPGQVFSRIHVADIAQVLLASMTRPNPGAIYNVCDDEPSPAPEVVAYACELLGQVLPPLIPFEQAELTPMARSFYGASRRVRNARIKDELSVTLKYPSYREGLRALANALVEDKGAL